MDDFEQRAAAAITDTVTQGDDRVLTRGERCEHHVEFLAEEVLSDGVIGS